VTRPGGRVVLAELGRYSLWAAWRRIKGWQGSDTWARAHFFTARAGMSDTKTATAAYLPARRHRWLVAHADRWEPHAEGWESQALCSSLPAARSTHDKRRGRSGSGSELATNQGKASINPQS
jgi:hypothetical protein